ncbi:hypothetical protein HDU87_008735 [Geranomyces variabilis]|uniref:Uncharacterized protein n=1 Tax=Geranomyces variabilis TaxID=109894 RepID=A0AAD5TCJ1_9FUNG|nr:hypothetical protein HDU87_008735 [Geranomyces variabilis]
MSFLFPSLSEKTRVDALLALEAGWKFEDVWKPLKNPSMTLTTASLQRKETRTIWSEIEVESSELVTPSYLLELPGALIEGKPGTGKSTIIRNFTRHLEEANFSFNVKKHPFREVIILDEIYMVNIEVMRHLVDYKKKNPATRFYIFGDYRQLPPVETYNYDYINGSVLKSLVREEGVSTAARITLIRNYRYNEETERILDAVWKDRKSLATMPVIAHDRWFLDMPIGSE